MLGTSVWLPVTGGRLAWPLGLQNRSALASAEARGSGAASVVLALLPCEPNAFAGNPSSEVVQVVPKGFLSYPSLQNAS